VDSAEAIAGHLHELSRVVRQSKQHWMQHRPGVPAGLLAGLALIESASPDGCHAKELAERSGLDPSTVSRAIAGLVSHGLVARVSDPGDRRATSLTLTPAGIAALAEARTWFATFLKQALAGWPPAEIDAFAENLGRFLADVHSHQRDWEAAR
jgi:DNA-binding MarR family transcriptional regulator